jgi:phenylalanyl-tRNA synthetase alpha chain
METTVSQKLSEVRDLFIKELEAALTSREVEEVRVRFLGRKGPVQALMGHLKQLDVEEKKAFGKAINDLKGFVQDKIGQKLEGIARRELEEGIARSSIDSSLPGRHRPLGREHPVQKMLGRCYDILRQMGFSIQQGPEVENEFYHFDGLNFKPDHPARDMQDTFYIGAEKLLRSHTTSIQQHVMEKNAPPIRIAAGGKCFRNETITARSHVLFHQVDVLYIDEGVSFADLLDALNTFYQKVFERPVELRVRASYFPFVEPGLEVDVACTACNKKGCALCKMTGYLEVCGAGMVHPNILRQGGIDPDRYSGFAWGGGIERLVMLLYGVSDIRLFTENHQKFLQSFPL